MKVYRGPETKPWEDKSHELVAEIKPEELEASIKSDGFIRFNISKSGIERQSVGTARFDKADLIPNDSGVGLTAVGPARMFGADSGNYAR